MEAQSLGGVGEITHADLPQMMARYRFFFHPVRYNSLGLAVCEAMLSGVPVVGLATTELVTVIENGVSGYLSTDVDVLIARMQQLIADPTLAQRLGQAAQQQGRRRFSLNRFIADWNQALSLALQLPALPQPSCAS
ncbi:MAG: glycosyltransferase family 4 protein [Leptolyngbyaceae cyanobacterium SM1_1_3]|nr:glycosyltransferase family 4 protein [Leptolyngbyaceae cyanobacterium SM1_1_3]NJN04967.1 glycosyltransferase family 4 protein [Leptolyngbyaceae cyanobacterium RM1_1_2]